MPHRGREHPEHWGQRAMAHYYDEPIDMVCDGVPDAEAEIETRTPMRFVWRERPYQVRAVLARWHLRDRWWATAAEAGAIAGEIAAGGTGEAPARQLPATNRFYWRLHCASPSSPMVFCIVYYDAASVAWRLERDYD